MTAPASAHAIQRAAWSRLWSLLLADDDLDSAAPSRPLGAGDQLTQQEADASRPSTVRAGFQEVNRRAQHTPIDNAF